MKGGGCPKKMGQPLSVFRKIYFLLHQYLFPFVI